MLFYTFFQGQLKWQNDDLFNWEQIHFYISLQVIFLQQHIDWTKLIILRPDNNTTVCQFSHPANSWIVERKQFAENIIFLDQIYYVSNIH